MNGDSDGLKLTAEIPQGLKEHQAMVVGLTVFATLVATAVVAYNFMKVKDRTESGKKNQWGNIIIVTIVHKQAFVITTCCGLKMDIYTMSW